jgi:hypothetical protein
MELLLYPKLSTRSRRAIRKEKGRWGHPYDYRPRGNLLSRLAFETGLSKEQVYDQLLKERHYLLSKDGEVIP